MTKEKAIAQLENLKEHCNEMSKSDRMWESDVIALDIAIKELKKEKTVADLIDGKITMNQAWEQLDLP